MDQVQSLSPAQAIADVIIESATLVEAGRIASLARQGLEDPTSLTTVQVRQVFAAFLLLFDPLVRLREESVPPSLLSIVTLPWSGPLATAAVSIQAPPA